MEIVRDNLLLCDDCLFAAVNGDFTGLDYHYGSNWKCFTCTREGTGRAPNACPFCTSEHDDNHGPHSMADIRMAEVTAGLEKLGPHLVPHFDSETGEGIEEFTWRGCSCCGSKLGGQKHRFAILGEVK